MLSETSRSDDSGPSANGVAGPPSCSSVRACGGGKRRVSAAKKSVTSSLASKTDSSSRASSRLASSVSATTGAFHAKRLMLTPSTVRRPDRVTYRVPVRGRLTLAAVLAAGSVAVAAHASSTETATLRLDGVTFRPELALTSAQQQRGLMFRKRAPSDGMLFVFTFPTSGGFWMKNTLVPLRIVFFDTRGRAIRSFVMTPCRKDPCHIYDPRREYRFALELPSTDTRPARMLGPPAALRALISRA